MREIVDCCPRRGSRSGNQRVLQGGEGNGGRWGRRRPCGLPVRWHSHRGPLATRCLSYRCMHAGDALARWCWDWARPAAHSTPMRSRLRATSRAVPASRSTALALYQKIHDADQRKNEFIAMLAHELRNPLAPIRNARSTYCDIPTAIHARDLGARYHPSPAAAARTPCRRPP